MKIRLFTTDNSHCYIYSAHDIQTNKQTKSSAVLSVERICIPWDFKVEEADLALTQILLAL